MVSINLSEEYIRIEMLGGFVIVYNGLRIAEQVKKPSKVWKLLQYLVIHRHKAISQDELIEIFCAGDHINDQRSTLRMLVSRARSTLLKAGLPFAEEMIQAKSGGYTWNNDVRCDIDADEFETLYRSASACADENDRLKLLMQATDLYRGDFLPNSSGDLWVMPIARWYHSLYVNSALEALRILTNMDRSVDAEELCLKALHIDPFNEKFIGFHLRSLLVQGKRADALAAYKRMESMFYDLLGIEFSGELKDLLGQIKSPEVKPGATIDLILDEWREGADSPGAYYCDINVFKVLYQIELRMAPRSGRAVYIVRIETRHNPKDRSGGVMKQLGMLIPGSLRMGDLFTRAGPDQYMIMLCNLTYEDCKSLVNRIIRKLDAKYLPKIVRTTINPITPISS